jgi:hypothetical protein
MLDLPLERAHDSEVFVFVVTMSAFCHRHLLHERTRLNNSLPKIVKLKIRFFVHTKQYRTAPFHPDGGNEKPIAAFVK